MSKFMRVYAKKCYIIYLYFYVRCCYGELAAADAVIAYIVVLLSFTIIIPLLNFVEIIMIISL